MNKKTATVIICCTLLVIFSIAVCYSLVHSLLSQYNADGISSILCISIDDEGKKEYIGELDKHRIYVERLKTDALYFTTVWGKSISLRDAVSQQLVSTKDWRKKASEIIIDGNTEILRYENYEIAINDSNCVIRPIK